MDRVHADRPDLRTRGRDQLRRLGAEPVRGGRRHRVRDRRHRLHAPGVVNLLGGFGNHVNQPAWTIDVKNDLFDGVVRHRLPQAGAERLETAGAESEQLRDQRAARGDDPGQGDDGDVGSVAGRDPFDVGGWCERGGRHDRCFRGDDPGERQVPLDDRDVRGDGHGRTVDYLEDRGVDPRLPVPTAAAVVRLGG